MNATPLSYLLVYRLSIPHLIEFQIVENIDDDTDIEEVFSLQILIDSRIDAFRKIHQSTPVGQTAFRQQEVGGSGRMERSVFRHRHDTNPLRELNIGIFLQIEIDQHRLGSAESKFW